jgi:hypothetical protein
MDGSNQVSHSTRFVGLWLHSLAIADRRTCTLILTRTVPLWPELQMLVVGTLLELRTWSVVTLRIWSDINDGLAMTISVVELTRRQQTIAEFIPESFFCM